MDRFNDVQLKDKNLQQNPIGVGLYEYAEFVRCDFSGVDLRGFSFTECDFIGCDLSNANVHGVSFGK